MSAAADQNAGRRARRPGRRVVGPLAALAAGPAAWVTQLVVGYGLAGHACFSGYQPARRAPPPGWSGEFALLLALNLFCLAVALIGLAAAWGQWRRVEPPEADDAPDDASGPRWRRFLAIGGMAGGVGFAIAILFDTAPILAVPTCWSIAP